jgi:hypothetical protein
MVAVVTAVEPMVSTHDMINSGRKTPRKKHRLTQENENLNVSSGGKVVPVLNKLSTIL